MLGVDPRPFTFRQLDWMHGGACRHMRATVFAQAKLTNDGAGIDGNTWVETGEFFTRGEPVQNTPEQEQAIGEYVRRIQEAGRFVMPE